MTMRWIAPVVALGVVAAVVACGSDDDDKKGSGGAGGTAASGGSAGSTGGGAGSGGSTGGSGGSTGGAGGTAGTAGGAGAGGSGGQIEAGAPITFSGQVTEFQQSIPDGSGPIYLQGAQVCQKDTTNCTTTDAEGKYSLMVPSNLESALLFTKTGYANSAIAGVVPQQDRTVNIALPSDTLAGIFAGVAKFTWPLNGKGIVLAFTYQTVTLDAGDGGTALQGLAGSTLSITPASGKGPVYVNDSQFPDLAATSTSKWGWGGFGDLPPGEYTVKPVAPGRTCTRGAIGSYPAAAADSGRVPVIADYITTAVNFVCD